MEEKDFLATMVANNMDVNLITNDLIHQGLKLQDKDAYKNTNRIKEVFKNPENGLFDDKKFDEFYKGIEQAYNQYAKAEINFSELPKSLILNDNAAKQLGLQSLSQPVSLRVKPNPAGLTTGIYDKDQKDVILSAHELGQRRPEYFDTRENKIKKNEDDIGGIIDYFKFSKRGGLILKHDKNNNIEYDEYGYPIYQTIDGMNVAGKENLMLNFANSLTEETSVLNNIDPFDSDQVKANHFRTLVKDGAIIAANLIPYTRPIMASYYLLTNGLGMVADAGSSIGSLINGITKGLEDKNNFLQGFKEGYKLDKDTEIFFNNVKAIAKGFTNSSLDEESASDPFSFGSISGGISDLVSQITSQRAIAQASASVIGSAKQVFSPQFRESLKRAQEIGDVAKQKELMEPTIKWAGNVARTFMTGLSVSEVGNAFESAGFSKYDADLARTIATPLMAAIMKYSPFETWMLKDFDGKQASKALQKIIRENGDDLAKAAKIMKELPTEQQKFVFMMKTVQDLTNNIKVVANKLDKAKDYLAGSSTVLANATNEAIEEATELYAQQGVNSLYNYLQSNTSLTKEKDKKMEVFGEDFRNDLILSIGLGALGGGIGGLQMKNKQPKSIQEAIQNGYTQDLLEQINNIQKLGGTKLAFASDKLSMEIDSTDKDGSVLYKPANKDRASQNDYIANVLRNQVLTIDQGLRSIRASHADLKTIQDSFDINLTKSMLSSMNQTTMIQDAKELSSKLLDVTLQINKLEKQLFETRDTDQTNILTPKLEELKRVQKQLDDRFDEFRKLGNKPSTLARQYIEQALFVANPQLKEGFGIKSLDDFKADWPTLSNEEVTNRYKEYLLTQRPHDISRAFQEAKEMQNSKFYKTLQSDNTQEKLNSIYKSTLLTNQLIAKLNKGEELTQEELKSIEDNINSLDYVTPDILMSLRIVDESNNRLVDPTEKLLEVNNLLSKPILTDNIDVNNFSNNPINLNPSRIYQSIAEDYLTDKESKNELDNEYDIVSVYATITDFAYDGDIMDDFLELYPEATSEQDLKNRIINDAQKILHDLAKPELEDLSNYFNLGDITNYRSDLFNNVQPTKELIDLIKKKKYYSSPKAMLFALAKEKPLRNEEVSFYDKDGSSIDAKLNTIYNQFTEDITGFKDATGDGYLKQLRDLKAELLKQKSLAGFPVFINPVLNQLMADSPQYFTDTTPLLTFTRSENDVPPLGKYYLIATKANEMINRINFLEKQIEDNNKLRSINLKSTSIYGINTIINSINKILGFSIPVELLPITSLNTLSENKLDELQQEAYKKLGELSDLIKEYDKPIVLPSGVSVNDNPNDFTSYRNSIASDLSDYDSSFMYSFINQLKRGDIREYFNLLHQWKEQSKFAPTLEQELLAFQAVSLYQAKRDGKPSIQIEGTELANNKFYADNTIFISSPPGIGKTEVISNILLYVIDSSVITSKSDEFVNNKLSPIYTDKSKLFKDLGIEKIPDQDVYEDHITNDNERYSKLYYPTLKDFEYSEFNNYTQTILIDEATHLNPIEKYTLVNRARERGQVLIFLGDSNQRGSVSTMKITTNSGEEILHKDTFFKYFPMEKTKRITTSFRAKTTNYDDNSRIISALLSEHALLPSDKIQDFVESVKKQKLSFSSFNNEGVQTIKSGEILNKYNELVKSGVDPSKIIVITDKNYPGVNTMIDSQVQGNEWDYVLIESMGDLINSNPDDILRAINTVLTRYKRGLFINEELLSQFIIQTEFQKSDKPLPQLIRYNEDDIAKFRDFSLKGTRQYLTGKSKKPDTVSGLGKAAIDNLEMPPSEILTDEDLFIYPFTINDDSAKQGEIIAQRISIIDKIKKGEEKIATVKKSKIIKGDNTNEVLDYYNEKGELLVRISLPKNKDFSKLTQRDAIALLMSSKIAYRFKNSSTPVPVISGIEKLKSNGYSVTNVVVPGNFLDNKISEYLQKVSGISPDMIPSYDLLTRYSQIYRLRNLKGRSVVFFAIDPEYKSLIDKFNKELDPKVKQLLFEQLMDEYMKDLTSPVRPFRRLGILYANSTKKSLEQILKSIERTDDGRIIFKGQKAGTIMLPDTGIRKILRLIYNKMETDKEFRKQVAADTYGLTTSDAQTASNLSQLTDTPLTDLLFKSNILEYLGVNVLPDGTMIDIDTNLPIPPNSYPKRLWTGTKQNVDTYDRLAPYDTFRILRLLSNEKFELRPLYKFLADTIIESTANINPITGLDVIRYYEPTDVAGLNFYYDFSLSMPSLLTGKPKPSTEIKPTEPEPSKEDVKARLEKAITKPPTTGLVPADSLKEKSEIDSSSAIDDSQPEEIITPLGTIPNSYQYLQSLISFNNQDLFEKKEDDNNNIELKLKSGKLAQIQEIFKRFLGLDNYLLFNQELLSIINNELLIPVFGYDLYNPPTNQDLSNDFINERVGKIIENINLESMSVIGNKDLNKTITEIVASDDQEKKRVVMRYLVVNNLPIILQSGWVKAGSKALLADIRSISNTNQMEVRFINAKQQSRDIYYLESGEQDALSSINNLVKILISRIPLEGTQHNLSLPLVLDTLERVKGFFNKDNFNLPPADFEKSLSLVKSTFHKMVLRSWYKGIHSLTPSTINGKTIYSLNQHVLAKPDSLKRQNLWSAIKNSLNNVSVDPHVALDYGESQFIEEQRRSESRLSRVETLRGSIEKIKQDSTKTDKLKSITDMIGDQYGINNFSGKSLIPTLSIKEMLDDSSTKEPFESIPQWMNHILDEIDKLSTKQSIATKNTFSNSSGDLVALRSSPNPITADLSILTNSRLNKNICN